MKKLFTIIFAFCITLSSFSSCMMPSGNDNVYSSQKESSSKKESSSSEKDESSKDGNSSSEEEGFTEVLSAQDRKTLKADETVTFDIEEDISGKNYIQLEYETDVHLYGVYTYANAENPSQVAEEEFFIEKDTSVFKQFLDTYRKNSVGAFDKILKSISFTNKSGKAGAMRLSSVTVSDRTFVEDDNYEIYIQRGELKVGADLALGGALTFLSRLSYNGNPIDEYKTTDSYIEIDVNGRDLADCEDAFSVDDNGKSEVNLINNYDAGRQIQQSYYANVGGSIGSTKGENGYMRGYCYTAVPEGYYWPYNPVQAGDAVGNRSQIVDYEITKDQIWIKTRAMDWSKGGAPDYPLSKCPNTIKGGSTTKSYMESTYKIANNMLFVTCRFIDWNGFYDMNLVVEHSNEIPAFFVSQALDTFVCYEGRNPWTGGNLTKRNEVPDTDENRVIVDVRPENWCAWVNNNDFGVGLYIPNTDTFNIGRKLPTTYVDDTRATWRNRDAFSAPTVQEYLHNKPSPMSMYTTCYVWNNSYVAPVKSWTMREYEVMSYQYAVCVDYIDNIRSNFKDVYQSGEIKNERLSEW